MYYLAVRWLGDSWCSPMAKVQKLKIKMNKKKYYLAVRWPVDSWCSPMAMGAHFMSQPACRYKFSKVSTWCICLAHFDYVAHFIEIIGDYRCYWDYW